MLPYIAYMDPMGLAGAQPTRILAIADTSNETSTVQSPTQIGHLGERGLSVCDNHIL